MIPGLALDRYRKQIKLDEPLKHESDSTLSVDEKNQIVDGLLHLLIDQEAVADVKYKPTDYYSKRQLLRSLLNIRMPEPLDAQFLKNINRLLQHETLQKILIDAVDISPVKKILPDIKLDDIDIICLWKGDITCLKIDAIVNAANDRLLGCFQPLHNCIDNAIHSAAGPMLRQDCNVIMKISNRPEQTGDAKITRAYNLPSRFVLHTVGPIILEDRVSEIQAEQLASCYRSCLDLAQQMPDIKNIAFPCISTGIFNFPNDLAAEIAAKTLIEWLRKNPDRFERIIFTVYKEENFNEYINAFRCFCNQ